MLELVEERGKPCFLDTDLFYEKVKSANSSSLNIGAQAEEPEGPSGVTGILSADSKDFLAPREVLSKVSVSRDLKFSTGEILVELTFEILKASTPHACRAPGNTREAGRQLACIRALAPVLDPPLLGKYHGPILQTGKWRLGNQTWIETQASLSPTLTLLQASPAPP